MLDCDCALDGSRHPAVGTDVGGVETMFLAIFQPFFADLIASDPVLVNFRREGAEVLRSVDVHALLRRDRSESLAPLSVQPSRRPRHQNGRQVDRVPATRGDARRPVVNPDCRACQTNPCL